MAHTGSKGRTGYPMQEVSNRLLRKNTVCPRSSDPFYIVIYYIQWVTTSWTYSYSFVRSEYDYLTINFRPLMILKRMHGLEWTTLNVRICMCAHRNALNSDSPSTWFQILIPILHYLNDARADQSRVGLMHIGNIFSLIVHMVHLY